MDPPLDKTPDSTRLPAPKKIYSITKKTCYKTAIPKVCKKINTNKIGAYSIMRIDKLQIRSINRTT
jgi:hypothetical protein